MLKKYKISDIGTVITGITPSTQNKLNYSNNDYKFICIPDFKANNRYLKNSNNYISKYAFDKIANKHLHKDDIAISCIGTIGNVGIIWDDCISNQQINSITSINKKFVPMYIYYNLSTKYLLLKKISGNGTALDIIPKSIFEKIEIDIHSIDEQQHIVNTIGTVDDLIEKYQEIIEKIVHYGDLLQAGKTNKKNIVDIAKIKLGGTPSRNNKSFWTNGKNKWINSGCLTNNYVINGGWEFITDEAAQKSSTQCGEKGSTVFSIIEPEINKVAILSQEIYFNQSIICIESNNSEYQSKIFFGIRSLINKIKRLKSGTAQQSINKITIEKTQIDILIDDSIDVLLPLILNLSSLVLKLKTLKQLFLDKYFK